REGSTRGETILLGRLRSRSRRGLWKRCQAAGTHRSRRRCHLRILHVSSEYPPAKVYGLGRFVHGLARAQAALGETVFVLTNSEGGAQDDVVLDGVWVHRI